LNIQPLIHSEDKARCQEYSATRNCAGHFALRFVLRGRLKLTRNAEMALFPAWLGRREVLHSNGFPPSTMLRRVRVHAPTATRNEGYRDCL